MFISKNDGLFNNDLNHSKDMLITSNSFIYLSRDTYTEEEKQHIKELMAS